MLTRTTRRIVGAAIAAALLAAPAGAQEPEAPGPPAGLGDGAPRFVSGDVLVRFKPSAPGAERAEARRQEGVTFEQPLPVPGLQQVETDQGVSVGEAVRALEDRPEVLYAQPNFVRRVADEPDPGEDLFDQLWGLENDGEGVRTTAGKTVSSKAGADISAIDAWDAGTGDSDVRVAVVDGGVDYHHPDLADNILRRENSGAVFGTDFCGDSSQPADDRDPRLCVPGTEDADPMDEEDGHGTHVAGTIGADGTNADGLLGVNWEVALMPVRVASVDGWTTDSRLTQGFDFAARNGAHVVNASFGGKGGAASQPLQDVIRLSDETLFVVAAGNDGVNNDQNPDFLCNIEALNLVCVTASDQNDQRAGFANFGQRSVDLAAPGANILSTVPSPFRTPFTAGFKPTVLDPVPSQPPPEGEPEPEPEPPPPPLNAWSSWTTIDGAAQTEGWRVEDDGAATDGSAVTQPPSSADPPADYPDDAHTWLTSRDLGTSLDHCSVRYRMRYELAPRDPLTPDEPGDVLTVSASSDQFEPGPEGTDDPVLYTDDSPDPGDGVAPLDSPQGSEYTEYVHDLDELAAPTDHAVEAIDPARFQLRFELETDGSDADEGVHVDDVSVECYDRMNGTSMATPHVAGVAALVFARNPDASPADVRRALIAAADRMEPFKGKTVSGGRLNAFRAVWFADDPPRGAEITRGPAFWTRERPQRFKFRASAPGSGFQCRVDGNVRPCPTPFNLGGLSDGGHSLQVRATGGGARIPWTDHASAPTHSFILDTTGPTMGLQGPLELTGRRVPAELRCPGAEPFGRCTGKVVLRSAGKVKTGTGKRKVKLGAAKFSIPRAADGSTTVIVSNKNRRLVQRLGSLRVRATMVAADSLGNRATTVRVLQLRAG